MRDSVYTVQTRQRIDIMSIVGLCIRLQTTLPYRVIVSRSSAYWRSRRQIGSDHPRRPFIRPVFGTRVAALCTRFGARPLTRTSSCIKSPVSFRIRIYVRCMPFDAVVFGRKNGGRRRMGNRSKMTVADVAGRLLPLVVSRFLRQSSSSSKRHTAARRNPVAPSIRRTVTDDTPETV